VHPFMFTSDIDSLRRKSTQVHEVPTGLEDKVTLLRWYAKALSMPDYFGENWDAFDECLRDLSWLTQHTIVLFHQDVPLAERQKDRSIYVKILACAVMDWKPGEAHELIVAFDPSCEAVLEAATRES
jgi:hypothetical protein